MLIGPRISLEIAAQSRLSREITRLNTEISGEKRILAPSDDPLASARVASIARDQVDRAGWKANGLTAQAIAEQADSVLETVQSLMDRAAELVIAARSPTGNNATAAAELQGIAAEIRLAMATQDSRGADLFDNDVAQVIPMSRGAAFSASPSRAEAFGPAGDTFADRLDAAVTALTANDATAIAASLDAIQTGLAQLNDARGAQGVRAGRIQAALDRLNAEGIIAQEERIGLEATDMTTAIPALQTKMLTLDAAQAAFTRINRRTLFDLLG